MSIDTKEIMGNKSETIIKIMDILGIADISKGFIDLLTAYNRDMTQFRIEQEREIKKEIIDNKKYTPEQRLQL